MKNKEEKSIQASYSEEAKRVLIEGLELGQDDFEKQLDRTHSPYWDARNDLSKTVISLASGSIVLTVTFSSSLIGSERANPWNYLLFGSWVSFLVTIIMAVVSLWISTSLKKLPASFADQKSKIREVIENEGSSEDIVNAIEKSSPNYWRVSRWSGRFHHASLIMFIVALLLLGLFGWRRFAA
jgi:hypothetical protein